MSDEWRTRTDGSRRSRRALHPQKRESAAAATNNGQAALETSSWRGGSANAPARPAIMVYLYHERQVAALCGQHCLNNLLQGPVFGAGDLASIAHSLDAAERVRARRRTLRYAMCPSPNAPLSLAGAAGPVGGPTHLA